MYVLTITWIKLYAIRRFSNLYGFRLAIYRGPHDITKYKYAPKMVNPGTGDEINGQWLVRESR